MHSTQSTCFPMLCLLTGVQLACSAVGHASPHALPLGANGRCHICVCAHHCSHTVYKKLVKHGTDYTTLTAIACQQAAQQQKFAFSALSSQMNYHCYNHDTCLQGAYSHRLHLMPAG